MAAIDPATVSPIGDEMPTTPLEELEEAVPSDVLVDIRTTTHSRIKRSKKSPLYRLRSLPTGARRLIMLAVVAMVGGTSLLSGTSTMAVVVFLTLSVISFWLAFRPIHRGPLPKWIGWGLAAGSLATAGIIALVAPSGEMPLAMHIECLVPGLGIALALLGLLRILKPSPLGFVPFAASVGAGLATNALLAGHCHIAPTSGHLLVGHGSVLVVLLAVAAAADAVGSRST